MLKDKTAIITGAARGIGKSIALKLAKLGCNIVVNYSSSEEEAAAVVSEIEQLGVKALAIKADVSVSTEVESMLKKVIEEFKTVDILINNAGITRDNLILRMKEQDFDKVIDINLKGTFNCLKQVTPIMLKKRSGVIINTSSVIGIVGNAGQANYAAAKAGILGLTRSAAKELGSRGIRVNAVAPGFIQTNMTEVLSDKIKQNILNNIPLKRLGEPEDVANVVAFLCSDYASYITGQVINVDGGMVVS